MPDTAIIHKFTRRCGYSLVLLREEDADIVERTRESIFVLDFELIIGFYRFPFREFLHRTNYESPQNHHRL